MENIMNGFSSDRLSNTEVEKALEVTQNLKEEDVSRLESIRENFQESIDQREEKIEEKNEEGLSGFKAGAVAAMAAVSAVMMGGESGAEIVPHAVAIGEALVVAASAAGGISLFQMGKDLNERTELTNEQGREEHLLEIMDQALEGESINLSSIEEKSVGESVTASPETAVSTEQSGRTV